MTNVTFQSATAATPPDGAVIETIAGVGGANRQVVSPVQATAANLNATVVAGGTFPVIATAGDLTSGNALYQINTGAGGTTALVTGGALQVNVVAGGAGGGVVTQATGANLNTFVSGGNIVVTGAVTATGGPFVVTQTTAANLNATVIGTGTFVVQTGDNVAQNSTTSGQTGPMIQAAVVSATAAYTTAHTSPLTLDTGGNLRVNVVAGGAGGGVVTQATAANLLTSAWISDGSGNALSSTAGALKIDIASGVNPNGQQAMAASSPVVIASDQSSVSVKQTTAANLQVQAFQTTGANLNVFVSGGAITATGGPFIVTQATGANLNTFVSGGNIAVTGTVTATGGPFVVTQTTAANLQVQAFQTTAANLNATVVGTGTLAVQATQAGSWTSIVTQATAANLNATVIGTGTLAVQATQAGSWTTVVTQPTAANLVMTVATNQSFATAAIFPTGPVRAQKGYNVVTIATTAETVIATAVASTQLDLYGLMLANTSATATKVTINQATAGINCATIEVPAGDTRGFMLPAGSAIPMTTAGNNLTAVLGTSVSGVVVTALYVKN